MKSTRSGFKSLVELVVTVAVAVGVALLIQALIVKPYRIPSPSMVPTLDVGQRVLVNRLDTSPGLGDVVVFHPPSGSNPADALCAAASQGSGHPQACDRPTKGQAGSTFIKRLVGLPGDRIQIIDGHVIRNGKPEHDPYIVQCRSQDPVPCNFRQSITIPPAHYFMMGDNRGFSDDSRLWGPVPQQWIIGVAFFTYWPLRRVGTL
ncbi:MAG: signal peptidase I [Actinomycetota bacterium]|nr:signal peptidase I [Actinomycetota bacterium]